jgi:biotin transporter BioY
MKFSTRDLCFCAIGAALIAVCAWISIPADVPFTLQTFAIFAVCGLLGGKRGTVSVLVYLLLGAVGAPVFAGFRGGFASLLGTTGGYLVGFVLLALIIAFAQARWGRGQWVFVLSAVVGLLVCYAFGTAWFLIVYTRTGAITLGVVLAKCVLPFLLPDAVKLALATLLCVLSPAALLLLAALSDRPGAAISENAAAGIGLCVLLVLVAVAVAVFITCAAQVKAYAFLESEPFETACGVTGMVRERRAAFAPRHTRGKVAGTVLCILSAVPLFIAVCLDGPDLLYVGAVCLLLVLAGVGGAVLVSGGVYWVAMDRLLEEDDYARPRKRQNGVVGAVSGIYWLVVTAAYLLWTFGPWWDAQPQDTWILWAVAGVLYGAVMALVRGIRK